MTNLSKTNIPTSTHGTIQVWQEVTPQNAWLQIPSGVWAAEGLDAQGRTQQGFGCDPAAAIVSCMEGIEMARQDQSAERTRVEVEQRPYQLAGLFGGRGFYPDEGTLVRKELPPSFWVQLNAGNKITAIKMLRDETGLTLKSSRDIVVRLMERKEPKFAATIRRDSVAKDAPYETVIRINRAEDNWHPLSAGVLERWTGAWAVAGDDRNVSDADVQQAIDQLGYALLFVPEGS